MNLSAVGLGCVTFGREIDLDTSFKLMDLAVLKGVNFLDTAAAYGNGASEKIVGKWLRIHPDSRQALTIGTKILPPYTPISIRESVKRSLDRLQLSYLDLLYLHHWSLEVNSNRTLMALQNLISEGIVRGIGVSNFNAIQLDELVDNQIKHQLDIVRVLQNNQNFSVREIDENIIGICRKNNIKIVTYSPLGAGYLTGKYLSNIEKGTRFSLIPGHQSIYFNDISMQRFQKLRKMAEELNISTTHLALIWAFHQPFPHSVLIGVRSAKHLEQAFWAYGFDDAEVIEKLKNAG